MAAFELQDPRTPECASTASDTKKTREECIIALKIYDSCRNQECLTPHELGPARAAEDVCLEGYGIKEGEIIDPPDKTAAVTIEKLRITKIVIEDKEPNTFKNGFWDIGVKFVFEYVLVFRESNGHVIVKVKAKNIFNRCVTLFGSSNTDTVFATDLFADRVDGSCTVDAAPYIMTDAKAVALSAELKYACNRRKDNEKEYDRVINYPNEVLVTIGLFSIVKLFRIVDLTVESNGFCIPPECEEICPVNPCELFERLDFPMDMFVPPQKREFLSGVSENIPRGRTMALKEEPKEEFKAEALVE